MELSAREKELVDFVMAKIEWSVDERLKNLRKEVLLSVDRDFKKLEKKIIYKEI